MPKHVYCDLIKAWADGAEIQYSELSINEWRDIKNPNWNIDVEFRIKPKPKIIKYRNFLWQCQSNRSINIQVSTEENNRIDPRERWNGFIKWLGDWQTIEVEDV
jgi:hypothetical protein